VPHRRAESAAAIVTGVLAAAAVLAPVAGAREARRGFTGGPGPVVIPLVAGQLAAPMAAYRGDVRRLLEALQSQMAMLIGEIDAGNVAGAESAWLTAHLTWVDIGQDDGAYGAFGQLGRAIDGTAAGLQLGTASPRFTGFHKVELDLWTDHDLVAARADAVRLRSLIATAAAKRLSRLLPTSVRGLTDWTMRCQEILEDALRDSLSGDDDYGSGTSLASVTADVSATRTMLSLLAPLITPRAPQLVGRARRQLVALIAAVAATRRDGPWVAVTALPTPARERVDAATGAALETLAPVPDLLKIGGDES
jgi:iron uptake system EfeUOB component EfeO/EfeM